MRTQKASPHLFAVLNFHKGIDPVQTERALAFALEHGGSTELGFARPEGQSFNPRPARIALIVIREAKAPETAVVVASILASAPGRELCQRDVSALNFDDNILRIVDLSQRPPRQLLENDEEDGSPAAIVALALHLDRARHLHLTSALTDERQWKRFLDETEEYVMLGDKYCKPLSEKLRFWKSQFLRLVS